jgi:parallel beta-helix repeat protein
MDTTPVDGPPQVSARSRGDHRCGGRRSAAVTLLLSIIAGYCGLSLSLAGQELTAPKNLRLFEGSAGPQTTVACPSAAVRISPGTSIQSVVNTYPAGTTFCLRAGTHAIKASITPKSGQTFVGEFGAVLDGTGWFTSDSTQAAFRAHNQDIDDVTIRNLVIRNMPQKGIHAYHWMSDRWTVENCELTGNHTGINAPNGGVIRRNWIHHNVGPNVGSTNPAERGGGYTANNSKNALFEGNEISFNGPEQKVTQTANVTFRGNYLHHNLESGIWYDGDNVGSLIENNVIEDNPAAGIFYEISGQAVIRNNQIRRSGDSGVFVSTSRDVEIYGNTLEHNWRGVNLFVSCQAVRMSYAGMMQGGFDLRNNLVRNNTVTAGSRGGSLVGALSADGTCTASEAEAYYNGSKNNTFRDNRYVVPSMSAAWWLWAGSRTWAQWQALGQDTSGAATQ